MKKYFLFVRGFILWAAVLLIPVYSQARCSLSGVTNASDGNSALIPFGKINLTDTYLQPVGTLLASVVVPPTNYTTNSATASSVLWTCDASDLSDIYFLVATNGDDRVGGYYDLGTTDGISGAYATWFGYTGLKLTMSGTTLTRYWQKIPVTTYATAGTQIQIRLQDIPPLVAELYRVSTLPGTSAGSSYCGNNNTDGGGIGLASSTGRNYTCTQPNAYIQLSGSSSAVPFGHDAIGSDSNSSYNFWGANNGFGYGMRTANTFYQTATCVARNATPLVVFPPVSAVQLMSGGSVNANFSVQVECSNTAVSGTAANQTAIGFQVSSGAFSAAQTLGLVNSSGGVTALVSDNYGAANMANGVGISLQNSLGTPMIFVGQPGTVALATAGGSAAGWYPVLDGASATGSMTSGYTQYQQVYTATLKKISGQTVTAGNVYATAYVLVKMQ